MDKKSLLTIIVVVIVVVAAVAAAVVLIGGNKNAEIDASLGIMGNANGDAYINNDDIDTIEQVISGELSFSSYPLADANDDGKVDDNDVELVEKMINHTSGITIYVICEDSNGDNYTQGITYPLSKTVVVGTNLISTIIQVGASNYILGYTKTNYGVAHAPMLEHATALGGSMFDLNTDESITNFNNLDTSCGGLDAVLCQPSSSYLKTSSEYIEGAGIPIIRLDSADGLSSIGSALTLGFIYGEETEKIAQDFAQFCYNLLDEIENALSGLEDSEKKTYFAVTMGYYICETDSDYDNVVEYAGGRSVSTLEGTSSSKIQTGETYYYQWNPDYIISFRTLDYSIDYTDISTGTTLTPSETWEKYQEYFDMLGDSYKGLVYINCSMPVVLRIAYLAEMMYPDLFDDGWADGKHQEFVDEYMSYLGEFDVTKDMTIFITYGDVFETS